MRRALRSRRPAFARNGFDNGSRKRPGFVDPVESVDFAFAAIELPEFNQEMRGSFLKIGLLARDIADREPHPFPFEVVFMMEPEQPMRASSAQIVFIDPSMHR